MKRKDINRVIIATVFWTIVVIVGPIAVIEVDQRWGLTSSSLGAVLLAMAASLFFVGIGIASLSTVYTQTLRRK